MSLTITSLIVFVLGRLLQWAGIGQTSEEELEHFVLIAMQIIGAIGVYVGRLRVGDITLLGTRKTSSDPLK